MAKITFSMGGVHPHDAKLAKDRPIEVLPLPQTVYVSMAQHLGAPAKPVVAVGDKVLTGQVIASMAAGLFSSIPITHLQPSTFCMMAAPRMISFGRSSMMR